jgi:uncharacterized membrane protein
VKGLGVEGAGRVQGREMAQTMYAHRNKWINKKEHRILKLAKTTIRKGLKKNEEK